MKRHYMIYMVCLLSFLCGMSSCTEDFPATGESELHGLVMQLQIDGNPVSAPASRVAADPTMRENVVSHVDVFFSSDGTNIDYYTHAALGTDNRLVLAGSDWKTLFPAASYTVYVLANKHDYADETNHLSDIATIEQLKELTDTDAEVNKAEGESSSGNNTYSGKLFFMDGVNTWKPPTDAVDETIKVELYRAAAKFVVNVSFASNEEFNLDDISIIGVRKKVVNYMPEAMALKEVTPDYENMKAVMGDASSGNMSNTNYTNGKQGEERKDILYAYAYPNHWGDNAERETYILINAPYVEGESDVNNYYKVPVRSSNDVSELHIDRNTQYTVNVTIDRKGNEEIDEPVKLNPTFSVAEWEPETINVDDDTPSYLILSDYNIEMHNEEEVTIEFFSSSALAGNNLGVTIDEAYFIDKDGVEQTDQNYYRQGYGGNIREEESDVPLSDLCHVEYDPNTLTGTITFTSEFVTNYLAATNITARYYTITVTNTDTPTPITRTIHIVQYPLEYISGVPGKYSTRDDYTNNTYLNWKNEEKFNREPETGGYYMSDLFVSKVYQSPYIYYMTTDYSNDRGDRGYYLKAGTSAGEERSNNRMYLVQITSTDESYIVARPALRGSGDDAVVKEDDEDNNLLVSPAFMLASQLGTVQPDDWSTAQYHCQQYVEVVEYEDGTYHEFKNWRLPTFAELKIIARYQNHQPEVMATVLTGEDYWSAGENKYLVTANALNNSYTTPTTGNRDTNCYIRCIRDVSPEDLTEFRAHNIR